MTQHKMICWSAMIESCSVFSTTFALVLNEELTSGISDTSNECLNTFYFCLLWLQLHSNLLSGGWKWLHKYNGFFIFQIIDILFITAGKPVVQTQKPMVLLHRHRGIMQQSWFQICTLDQFPHANIWINILWLSLHMDQKWTKKRWGLNGWAAHIWPCYRFFLFPFLFTLVLQKKQTWYSGKG